MMEEFLDFKVKKELIEEWLKRLYELSNEIPDFVEAISIAKIYTTDEEDIKLIDLLHTFYLNEISGKIKPPLSLATLYLKVNNL